MVWHHLIRTRLRDTWPPHLLQRYRWGLHWDRRLPFCLHPSKTFSRLEQSTTNCVLHADSLRPTQPDGCFCHLLPFANRLPGADRTFGRSTSPSPYLEDTSTLRPHGRPRPLSTGHRRVLQLRHTPPHGLHRRIPDHTIRCSPRLGFAR